jgi:excisionase family DNA binding protein
MTTPTSKSDAAAPLAVTVPRACELVGCGATTLWRMIREHHIEVVRLPGVRRTLVSYASLARLLKPAPGASHPALRRRGRPRKYASQAPQGAA